MEIVSLALNPVPENLREEYDDLIRDPWLLKKTNRASRVVEKQKYINEFIPELKLGGRSVLDIGCGTGEFLEFSREYKNVAVGVEKWHDLKSRWNIYTRYSRIQWARQGLDVRKHDFFELILNESTEFDGKKFDIINCQHAINYIFKNVFDFKEGQTVYFNDGNWLMGDDFNSCFSRFFAWCSEHLEKNGLLLVASLRSENRSQYSTAIDRLAGKSDLGLIMNKGYLVHKWRKL